MRTFLLTLALAAAAAAEPRVTVVAIEGEIGPSTVYLVKRSLEAAKADGSSLVVFEINTPGGRLDSALDIAERIERSEIATAAYVKGGNFGGAQSAGALISIACGRIVMEPSATIGSAQPVGSDGVMSSEKIVSWVAAQFRAKAEKHGLPALIAMGMVDPDLEVREVEVNGAPKLVNGLEFAEMEQRGAKVKVLRQLKLKGKLLNLTAREARELGISHSTADSVEKACVSLGVVPGSISRISEAWGESFVAIVTMGIVTGILIALGFIFIWIECKTVGVGIPALLATACFGTVFFGHYLVGTAQATEILLFAIGAILLIVEFLTPGFAVVGASGLLLMGAGLILALQNFVFPSNPYQWNSLAGNFLTLTASTGGAVIGFAAIVRFLPNTPMFKQLILKSEVPPAEAPAAVVLIGREGIAMTPLRPSGKVEVDGMTLDVVAEGEFVEAGTKITVVKAEGPSVVVRRV
ncbi:MAG: NfeD family protein [Planctomycetota bacterium]